MEEIMKNISKAEELLLLSIWRLNDKAYGISIRRKILEDTGKDYTYGTLYDLLRQLTHKEYVDKISGKSIPKKGGRGKTYYKLTLRGIQALKYALEFHRLTWKDVNEFSFEKI